MAKFLAFSVAIDESTDIAAIAKLAIFISGDDASLTVTSHLLMSTLINGHK